MALLMCRLLLLSLSRAAFVKINVGLFLIICGKMCIRLSLRLTGTVLTVAQRQADTCNDV